MSAHHLIGFVEDLRMINPQYRRMTSSVGPLVSHLQRTVRSPTPITFEQAVGRCRTGRRGSLEKYKPAIQRLVSVWGKGSGRLYPTAQGTKQLREHTINRLCFRGDGRPPEGIFVSGFDKRNLDSDATYRNYVADTGKDANPNLHLLAGMTKAGDVDPFSVVCVSPDMNVSALFPAPTADNFSESTWLYLVMLRRGYNTSGRQVLDALKGFRQLATHELGAVAAQAHDERVDALAMLLYGREMAADAIPASDVLMAMKIKRHWNHVVQVPSPVPGAPPRNKADFWQGGRYVIEDFRMNHAAIEKLAPDEEIAVLRFMVSVNEYKDEQTRLILPTPDSGYVPSTRT